MLLLQKHSVSRGFLFALLYSVETRENNDNRIFAATGASVDASQEMLTLGLCNVIGSLCKSMPTCGAFTRSAVSHVSGVKTPMAGLYSSIMTVLALSLLTPYFYYIPKATLAAVLVIAVVFMVNSRTHFKSIDSS